MHKLMFFAFSLWAVSGMPEIDTKVVNEDLTEKTAVFFGDSITEGYLTEGYSWANYIEDNYEIEKCVNAGVDDFRVSSYADKNKWLVNEVINHYNDEGYDYVILQGGINDLLLDTPLGEIAPDKKLSSFNPNTFIGGLETYLYMVTNKWPDAHIGYIITYKTLSYYEGSKTWQNSDYEKYYGATKEVLDKWNIPYIDLSSAKFTKKLSVNTTDYLSDRLHLNKEGYEIVSPEIYKWMKTIKKYHD